MPIGKKYVIDTDEGLKVTVELIGEVYNEDGQWNEWKVFVDPEPGFSCLDINPKRRSAFFDIGLTTERTDYD